MCYVFCSGSREVSQLHSTQMTCLSLNSNEEGQGQPQGPAWVGLETWDNLTGETSQTNGPLPLNPRVKAS